ncbi:MAG: abortive infection family protein [Proteobacteria bacterium]|nr:abortive infection family protein [Pseudomonadota bacterium]
MANDPDLAIGTAKDLIETCCKTLLGRLGEEVLKNTDFPELVRRPVRALKLTRDDIPDDAKGAAIVRNILSNLSAISRGVNELRNIYGTGRGRESAHKALDQRHARLAVATAAAFVVFISDTYHERE